MAPAGDLERANANAGAGAVSASSSSSSSSIETPPQPPLTLATEPADVFQTPRSSHDNAPQRQRQDDDEEEDVFHDTVSSTVSPSSITTPPYWTSSGGGHQRSISNMSADSVLPEGAITLRDNEASEHHHDRDRNSACWAKSVVVSDFTVVNGSATNIGAFVVWNIRVETLNGAFMNIRKRYSEFDDFRSKLVLTFPGFEAAVPSLPPKSVISKFRPRFLEKRRAGLQYFLNCILLNPEFSGSPVLKEFLFA